MPAFSSLPIPDLLRAATDLYTNARDDAEAFAVLSADPWAFTAEDFDAGLSLVKAVRDFQKAEVKEELESQEATDAYDAAVDAVRKVYLRHRGAVRRRHGRGTPVYSALGLAGDAPDDREGLLSDAADFYAGLADRPDVVAETRGLTEAGVAEAEALMAEAIDKGADQTRESGDVDRVSAQRQDAVVALRRHASLTAADAKAALADHPQLQERLGLLDRS